MGGAAIKLADYEERLRDWPYIKMLRFWQIYDYSELYSSYGLLQIWNQIRCICKDNMNKDLTCICDF